MVSLHRNRIIISGWRWSTRSWMNLAHCQFNRVFQFIPLSLSFCTVNGLLVQLWSTRDFPSSCFPFILGLTQRHLYWLLSDLKQRKCMLFSVDSLGTYNGDLIALHKFNNTQFWEYSLREICAIWLAYSPAIARRTRNVGIFQSPQRRRISSSISRCRGGNGGGLATRRRLRPPTWTDLDSRVTLDIHCERSMQSWCPVVFRTYFVCQKGQIERFEKYTWWVSQGVIIPWTLLLVTV